MVFLIRKHTKLATKHTFQYKNSEKKTQKRVLPKEELHRLA